MNVIIFGGTFDPPTLAHEAIIKACLCMTDMDQVWVMPSGFRSDKPGMQSKEKRLSMLHVMKTERFNDTSRIQISSFEIMLNQPTQTIDSVRALQATYPDVTFWFVFGADSYYDMPSWREGKDLQRSLSMLLVARKGCVLPKENGKIKHLNVPNIVEMALSSTNVRRAVSQGMPIATMVSLPISNFVQRNCLYSALQ